MITKKTAEDIWQCYREIEAGKKLLQDMEKVEKDNPKHKYAQYLKDAFGHRQELQLGIPMGGSSHRLFGVSPKLALSVIRSHIATKRAELVEVNERARIELGGDDSQGPEKEMKRRAEVELQDTIKMSIKTPTGVSINPCPPEPPGLDVL